MIWTYRNQHRIIQSEGKHLVQEGGDVWGVGGELRATHNSYISRERIDGENMCGLFVIISSIFGLPNQSLDIWVRYRKEGQVM
jgi:hypothetical protein